MKKNIFGLKRGQVFKHVPKILELVLFIVMSPAHALLASQALLVQHLIMRLRQSPFILLKFAGKLCFTLFIVHV